MMWIRRSGDETINLDKVTIIVKTEDKNSNEFEIRFQTQEGSIYYVFKNSEELEEYYESLMKLIGALEVPLLKI